MATSTTSANHGAAREKRLAALSSVLAAVALTTLKLVVGLMTGSLGILSEAAHSGLDLVAALVTLFAVRISDTPPDQRHRYGHGKVENLSALIETLLLLLTCAWIIYEAIRRLFFEEVAVEASIWAFVVMGVSVLVDFSRSRVLARTARKYNSQALEADALHFSTDIWSALVVILGLIGVRLSEASSRLAFLAKADAVAALVVAMIVVYVSVQLGRRSVAALLDSAPPGLAAKIERAVRAVPGVLDCHRVRVRTAGPQLFVDIHVVMDGALSLEETHALSSQIEEIIAGVARGAYVMVHAEPPSEAQPRSE